ncbi:MAG: CoA-binding protein, partial [Thermodesulfobacteriota bacterium]|nr:CoA-binding protein [Thermodesulfobacteriota bacterium]
NLRPAIDPAAVGAIFNPKSVAVVGATDKFRKWGNMIFLNLVAGGFKGEIYPVNPTLETLAGRPAYKSVTDIPGPVDMAVVTVPASKVLDLIPEFKAKGVKGVVLITSGFAEAGPEGRELERLLVEEAHKSGVLILGPNTMGITNPHINLFCIGTQVRPKPGSTAFVSQSGNMGVQLLSFANRQGLGIRAFGGTGNEAMLTVEDALDAFGLDELTDAILLYIESVKNGRRFFESARRVSRQKPVVVLRGGRTPAGSVAAATHTGAMASNVRVFDAACRQAGIVLVEKPMDLLDLSTCFSSLPLPRGKRVAIMTIGGGWGVVTSDLCTEYGLELPELPPDLVSRIDRVLPPFWSRCNPVDLVGQTDPGVPIAVMDELLAWDGCDALINLGVMGRKHLVRLLAESSLAVDPRADKSLLDSTMQGLDKIEIEFTSHIVRLMEEHNKPIIGVGMASDGKGKTIFKTKDGRYKGVFFQTPEQAVKSLSRMRRYREWLEREGVFT